MKKAFLKFMEHVLVDGCPFYTFNVSTYKSYIEVVFVCATAIKPADLGWINTHLVDGRWFVVAEDNSIRLIIRFDNTEDD